MNTQYNDDQFNYDPTQYVDQNATILPQPGEYTVRATSITSPKKDRTSGEIVLSKGKYPVLTVNRLEIVEPEDDNGTFAVFADVRTSPYKRKAGKGTVDVAPMTDLVRSVDIGLATEVESFEQSIDVATRELQSGSPFRVKLGYKAVDFDAAKAQLAKANGDPDAERAAWNTNTYYTKAFRRADGKGYNQTVTTPDGKILEAKLVIDSFVASNKHGKSGAFAK